MTEQPEPAPDPRREVGSERYVRFLEPHQRGSSPYTVEGYLGGISSFASGAVRARGWRRPTAKVLVVVLLLPIALTILHWLWTLLDLLSTF
ncbi:MAG TPA: hypothetical protein VHC49_12590 [Mycobacteriales bacterium]|nr:hypothetical protein [Mycobacteriales bacterium]